MKARMETAIDTLWSNQVTCSVETELDNPHLATTRQLASLMAESLQALTEELRAENERAGAALADFNTRHRQLDDREVAIETREARLIAREERADEREANILTREDQEGARDREDARVEPIRRDDV